MTCWCLLLLICVLPEIVKMEPGHRKQEFQINNCGLTFEPDTDTLKNLNESAKLMYITMKFRNTTELPVQVYTNSITMNNPLNWVRISGTHGSGLLQLRPNYEILSMNILAFQTQRTEIELQETHAGCLKLLNASEYEYLARKFLLQYTNPQDDIICNAHVKATVDGYADFYHECCYKTEGGEIMCYDIEKNSWMKAIDVCTYIVIVLAILYCPYLIPSSFYRTKYAPSFFEHHPDKPLSITVKKSTDSKRWWHKHAIQHKMPLSKFSKMEYFFTEVLEKMKNDKIYELKVLKLNLKVSNDQIVSDNETPTGLFQTLYAAFVKCGIRDKRNKNDCCNANLFGCLYPFGMKYQWYKCLRLIMRIVLCIVASSMWILRLCVYYLYEDDIRLERKRAADLRNLELHLNLNLAYFLTPIHVLFIVCYSILAFDYVVFGFVSQKLKLVFQIMMQTCLQDMRDAPKSSAINWAFRVLTMPLRVFGIFGFIFGLSFWVFAIPVVVIVLSFRFFPTVNLSMSLIMNVLYFIFPSRTMESCKLENCENLDLQMDNKKTKTGQQKFQVHNPVLRLILILIAILTFASFVLLTVECIIFVIEVAVYTLIGLIVNSSHAMQYISALSIGWLYFKKCFSGIDNQYLKYNKFLQMILQEDNKEKVTKVAQLQSNIQSNTAFKVTYADKQVPLMVDSHGRPKWATNGVVLLLDKYDNLYITKDFFFDACLIKHPHCPGKLSSHFMLALKRFLCIAMFLVFVLLVVSAFGDAYSISISNQLLATVAGGFVPWILMKSDILFPKPEEPDLGQLKNNLNFMTSLQEMIFKDKEEWNIQDIIVNSMEMVEEEAENSKVVNGEKKENGINVHTEKQPTEPNERAEKDTESETRKTIDLLIDVQPHVTIDTYIQ